jgi:glycosyltransferase involved in cell wall biosynthesis
MPPSPLPDTPGTWLVAGVPRTAGSGGSLRATHVLEALARRANGQITSAFGRRGLPALALAVATRSRLWRTALNVASLRLLPEPGLALLRGAVRGRVLDLHDHPRLQLEALGMSLASERVRKLDEAVRRNIERFDILSVPSASFADLCALPADKVIVATNGTDPQQIVPRPFGDAPVVAMVSGAAPGRGIELLIHTMAAVRSELPAAVLQLALTSTGPDSQRYLDELTRANQALGWVKIESVRYRDLGAFLSRAQALVIPHPPHAYLDAATPVKLFDGMAAGRPTAATPRVETARILEREEAGVVAGGDSVDDLGEAILRLLTDEAMRHRLGANARRAAVEEFDWRRISERLATAVLDRIG